MNQRGLLELSGTALARATQELCGSHSYSSFHSAAYLNYSLVTILTFHREELIHGSQGLCVKQVECFGGGSRFIQDDAQHFELE